MFQNMRSSLPYRTTPYGPLTEFSPGYWSTVTHDKYSCRWLAHTNNRYRHFSVTEYKAQLRGNSSVVEQCVTDTVCSELRIASTLRFCVPQEAQFSIIVWFNTGHDFCEMQLLGNYTVNRIDNYVLIPALRAGVAIQTVLDKGNILQLDTGLLLKNHHAHVFTNLYHNMVTYAKTTQNTGVLALFEAHYTATLIHQSTNFQIY